jgi:inward rectifier potassium channel
MAAEPKPSPVRPQFDPTNVVRLGLKRGPFSDLYHFLLKTTWLRLVALFVALYVILNALFALAYMAQPGAIENARPGSFFDAFFFSVQTMATIGYGKMTPVSAFANVLVSIEALFGLLGFAMATGLIFAKFSRPTSRVLFSRVAVIAPRDGVPSLFFRMGNERANLVVEAQLGVTLLRNEVTAEGERIRRIYDLKLQRARSPVFTLSWTAIHPITPDSPLHGQTAESLAKVEALIVASFRGLDDTFSQDVHARHTYAFDQIVWGGRFADIIGLDDDGRRVIDYARFHDVLPIEEQQVR